MYVKQKKAVVEKGKQSEQLFGEPKFGEPTKAQLRKINALTNSNVNQAMLFVYPIRISDNLKDRHGDVFSIQALKQIAKDFIGKSGVKEHNVLLENQHSRVFDSEVIVDENEITPLGEPYTYVKLYAYMLRTEANRDLMMNIEAGIYNDVSIGVEVNEDDEEIIDYGDEKANLIKGINEIQEFSFVAIGAQPKAKVLAKTLTGRGNEVMDYKKAVLKLKGLANTDDTAIEVIDTHVREMELKHMKETSELENKCKTLEKSLHQKSEELEEMKEEVTLTKRKASVDGVMNGYTPKSDKAKELIEDIVNKTAEYDDDGGIVNIEEIKKSLDGDYHFLFEDTDSYDDDKDDDDDEYKEETKEEYKEDLEKKVKNKSLGFTPSNKKQTVVNGYDISQIETKPKRYKL